MNKTATFMMFVGDQCGKAEEAIMLYTSLFKNSEVKNISYFKEGEPGGREGLVKHAIFTLAGQEYMANDSPMAHEFTFTPAISIFVDCDNEEEIDHLFKKLSEKGAIMMELGDYGFSRKFGWTADRYGVSWQLNLKA